MKGRVKSKSPSAFPGCLGSPALAEELNKGLDQAVHAHARAHTQDIKTKWLGVSVLLQMQCFVKLYFKHFSTTMFRIKYYNSFDDFVLF